MERTYSQIDMDERRKIARWRTAGISVDVIAEKLGRHRSTIFRELRRNAFDRFANAGPQRLLLCDGQRHGA